MAEPDVIVCSSYTHARRHPMVLGRIAGWTPPFQLSVTQLAVLVGGFLALNVTRPLWAPLTPGSAGGVVLIGGPSLAAWMVRRVRVEGRTLPRATLGWLTLWCLPRSGRCGGRPVRNPRATTWTSGVVISDGRSRS